MKLRAGRLAAAAAVYMTTVAILGVAVGVAGAQPDTRGLVVSGPVGGIARLPGNAGKRHAICIGIDRYEDGTIKGLSMAGNDARGLGSMLGAAGQFDSVFVMTTDVDPRYDTKKAYPRLSNIRARMEYLKAFIKPDDLVVFSFSGHGIADESGNSFLVAADSSASDPLKTGLPLDEVFSWLSSLRVRKALVLVDACRETVSTRVSRSLTGTTLRTEKYESAEVAAVFFATRTGWYSYEDETTGYGLFTRYVLEGLQGKADYQHGNTDGVVTFRELSSFVEDAVSTHALALGLKQRPYTRLLSESSGDLALTAYSATIDPATRSYVSAVPQATGDAGRPGGAGGGLPGSGSGAAGSSPGGIPGGASGLSSGYGDMPLRIFSNVGGTVRVDGAEYGTVIAGEIVVAKDLPPGEHFIELFHEYGVFRGSSHAAGSALPGTVSDEAGTAPTMVNLVVIPALPPRVIAGVPFLYVPGNDRPGPVAAGSGSQASGGTVSAGGGGPEVRAFWMAESEVTVGQYALFARQSGYLARGQWQVYDQPAYSEYPVINLTHADCVAYAEWFSSRNGVRATLPSAAQHAIAAGGRHGRQYPWGDSWDASFCQSAGADIRGALPVAGRSGPLQRQYFRFDMTLEGIAHLAGNVREWCTDTKTSADGALLAMVAGGSWKLDRSKYFTAGYSSWVAVTAGGTDLGFRLAIAAD